MTNWPGMRPIPTLPVAELARVQTESRFPDFFRIPLRAVSSLVVHWPDRKLIGIVADPYVTEMPDTPVVELRYSYRTVPRPVSYT